MHLKRKNINKFWPINKTGTKYLAVACHEKNNSIPLIVFLRDVLKLVKSKKELKPILNKKKIIVNGNIIKEPNYPLLLYDCLSFPEIKKHYRIILLNKKLSYEEINEKESIEKIYKVINKKVLIGKKIQLNLIGGKNILTNEKINVGDFILLNNKDNKLIKIISLKNNVKVMVVKGKHIGKEGVIISIEKAGENTIAKLKTKDGELNVNVSNLYVIN